MKVVCINNITTSEWEEGEIKTDLVIGEIYNVIDSRFDGEYYEIETEEVFACFYKKNMFQKLDDWRNDKLNKLGI